MPGTPRCVVFVFPRVPYVTGPVTAMSSAMSRAAYPVRSRHRNAPPGSAERAAASPPTGAAEVCRLLPVGRPSTPPVTEQPVEATARCPRASLEAVGAAPPGKPRRACQTIKRYKKPDLPRRRALQTLSSCSPLARGVRSRA